MAQFRELFVSDGFHTFAYTLFLWMAAIVFIYELIAKISKMIGKPLKWVRQQDEEAKRFESVVKKQDEIETKLNALTEIVLDDRIDRMRYEILDMASAIAESKRWYSVEQIKHTLKIYDEYEKVLEENGRQNGEVEVSIEVIKKAYKDKYDRMGGNK